MRPWGLFCAKVKKEASQLRILQRSEQNKVWIQTSCIQSKDIKYTHACFFLLHNEKGAGKSMPCPKLMFLPTTTKRELLTEDPEIIFDLKI